MADLIPSGVDNSTGQHKQLTSGDTLVDVTGNTYGTAFPSAFIEGFNWLNPNGGTLVTVQPGSCRDSSDVYNMLLSTATGVNSDTAHSGSDGLATLNGMDEKGLDNLTSGAITCSQSGTTITTTASILPHLGGGVTLTGTISSTGTAVTGTGTSFRDEVSIGDIIGSTTTIGFARIASIESDTALTLELAFPGGNASGAAFDIYYAPTIRAATQAVNEVGTINAAGTSIVVAISGTAAASSALTVGGPPTGVYGYDGGSTPLFWLHIWLVDNGTTPGLLVSTQRHEPLAPPSGYNRWRRLGAIPFVTDSPGIARSSKQGAHIVNPTTASFSTTTTGIVDVNLLTFMPQTTRLVYITVHLTDTSGGANDVAVRSRDDFVAASSFEAVETEANGTSSNTLLVHSDASQYIEVNMGSAGTLGLRAAGYIDDLSFNVSRVAR